MNTERAEQIYNVYYFNEMDPFGIHSRSFYKIRDRVVLESFGELFSGSKQMLDLASGPGTLMKKISSANPKLKIICSDMNKVALKFLKANTSFEVLELKLPEIKGVNTEFDILSCFDTFYLLNENDMQTAIDRIFQLIKGEGGIFIVDSDLSDKINPLKFKEKLRVSYCTDKISKMLFFSVEEKFRDKYYVLNPEYRKKLKEFGLLPSDYEPRFKNFFLIVYYLLSPFRFINRLIYSSVTLNKFFSVFGKEKYEIFVYERLQDIKKPIV